MYTYVSALMKPRARGSRWQNVNISAMLMRNIFRDYFDGYIKLTNPALSSGAPRWLRLQDLKTSSIRKRPGMSFTAWLAEIGSITLPTTTQEPSVETKRVLYSDAYRSRYLVDRIHPTANPSIPYPLADKTDLLLSRTGVQPEDFYENVMVSVNGLFHMTDLSIYGVKVKDGGKSADVSQRNNIGLLSFREIGTIEHHTLDSSMMTKPLPAINYKQSFWLNTGINMVGKSPILVLGGYLHVQDSVFEVVNPALGLIKVNMDKVALLHRFFESKNIIDLTSLDLAEASYNDELVAIEELYSDETIEALVDLSQTFLVLVDAQELYIDTHLLQVNGIPGVYFSGAEPHFPLKTRWGLMPEYWLRKEYEQWVLSIHNGLAPNYLFETYEWQNSLSVDTTQESEQPVELMRAHLLEIGNETIVFAP